MIAQAPKAEDAVLAEVIRRLVGLYRPERVYLFGSMARGDAGPDSDFEADLPLRASLPATAVREGRLPYGRQ
jgi:predicted nucleotidyltransferase